MTQIKSETAGNLLDATKRHKSNLISFGWAVKAVIAAEYEARVKARQAVIAICPHKDDVDGMCELSCHPTTDGVTHDKMQLCADYHRKCSLVKAFLKHYNNEEDKDTK